MSPEAAYTSHIVTVMDILAPIAGASSTHLALKLFREWAQGGFSAPPYGKDTRVAKIRLVLRGHGCTLEPFRLDYITVKVCVGFVITRFYQPFTTRK